MSDHEVEFPPVGGDDEYIPEREEPDETTLENVLYLLGGEVEIEEDSSLIPEPLKDELDESFFGIDFEERQSRIIDYLRSREDTRDDSTHLEKLGKLWGIKNENLVEIYENRGFSIRAVEELIYLTLRLKDEALGPNQPLVDEDLEQIAGEMLPSQVRQHLNGVTFEALTRMGLNAGEIKLVLGMEELEEREWFAHLSDKERKAVLAFREEVRTYDRSVRGLYLVAWLADQNFMQDYDDKIKMSFASKSRRNVAEMLNKAIAVIDAEGHLLIAARRRGDDQRVDFKRVATLHKFDRMVTCKRMCELIALGKYRTK